ncbi:antibiotic biosynthesis monooxygenase [Streptomyces mashuensis]|uniref:Antibiotic biosynthesis monooxygenase n=1 Tax=Streptomyces mashuensis TaxID=33904 RepID=A0A919B9V0_9ACTN|nr:antibiotic biosynthesis monooxygenase family protein [Streptomyces mashuensis]GHF69305.1 antibiotic biosynthesis monooxygenase [Streptomyces mashuensis]
MTGEVRVLVRHVADSAEAIEHAYRTVSEELAGVAGMLGNELLRDVHDDRVFVVLSRWRDLAAFRTWEAGAAHRASTSPLRPFRDRAAARPFEVLHVTAAY